MRRLLVCVAVLCLLAVNSGVARAAEPGAPMDAGLLVGMNLPVMKDATGHPGLSVGAYYNLEFDPLFSLELSAMYSYDRFSSNGYDGSLHRLGVPLFARLWLMPGVSVGAGPFATFKLKSDPEGADDFDAGVAGSLSMKYPFGRLQSIFDVRYLQGLVQSEPRIGELQILLGGGYFF